MSKRLSIDGYIASFPEHIQHVLQSRRTIIQKALPHATETISYNIPAFAVDGVVVIYFSAYTAHISLSFYPTEPTYAVFTEELQSYKHSKSAIQFPLTDQVPEELVTNIVQHATQVRLAVAASKKR